MQNLQVRWSVKQPTQEFYQVFLKKLRRELSLARRTTRFFKQIQMLWSVIKLIKGFRKYRTTPYKKEGHFVYVLLRVINNINGCVFFCLDHVLWSYMVRIHRDKDLFKKAGDTSDYFWILQNSINIVLCLIEMNINNKLSHKVEKKYHLLERKKSFDYEEDKEQLVERLAELDQSNHELGLEIIRAMCDGTVSLNSIISRDRIFSYLLVKIKSKIFFKFFFNFSNFFS